MNSEKTNNKPFAYFKSLDIENIKCFKGKHHIDLTDKDGKPAKWTVIMGNNGTGKTTLLRCLADLEPEFWDEIDDGIEFILTYPTFQDDDLYQWLAGRLSSKIKVEFADFKGNFLIDYFVDCSLGEDTITKRVTEKDRCSVNHIAYGVQRKMGLTTMNGTANNIHISKILAEGNLINAEEWLLRTFLAQQNGIEKAKKLTTKIIKLLINILPDVNNLKIITDPETLESYVNFDTDFGLVRINDLGYGYQSLMAWVIDFAKKMFDKYPNSENPLAEAAVVLVDEIALHLHPDWQRDIINYLDTHFPKTQFIVTTHSPLVVQSAENINLVLLEKTKDSVIINQPDLTNFKGWSIEEIMSQLMGLGKEIHSDEYLNLMKKFEEGLAEENYEIAKAAYDQLDKILHPNSEHRTLLKMRMSGIMPMEAI